jgi:hypothetical protein
MTKALNLENFAYGKYDIVEREIRCLINVTWDCFDPSNFYISRINIIEWNNIHLFTLYKGDMKICSQYPREK